MDVQRVPSCFRVGLVTSVCLTLMSASLWAEGPSAPRPDFGTLSARAAEAREAHRTDDAIALYREALSSRSTWAEGWWYLGTLLYDRDGYAEAATAFERSAALDAKNGSVLVMLGLCEFQLGRHDDALRHIQEGRRRGTSIDPQFRRVMLYHEGLLLLGRREFERAQQTLGLLSREGADSNELIVALGLSVLRIRPDDLPADPAVREAVRRAGWAEHLAARKDFAGALREYERLASSSSAIARAV